MMSGSAQVLPFGLSSPAVEVMEGEAGPGYQETDDGDLQITIGTVDLDEDPDGPDPTFDRNLALDLDEMTLNGLASQIIQGIDSDLESRQEWEDTANRAADYLGIKLDDPAASPSVEGTVCQAIATTMLEAVVKLWSTARAELLPAAGPVKVRRDSTPTLQRQAAEAQDASTGMAGAAPVAGIAGEESEDEASDDLAEALQSDMNHFLTAVDREYYPDFSRMLFNRGLVGLAFRKVYRCPIRRRPRSAWVRAQDLIVHNDSSHLSGAGRVTERIRMRQSVMRRMQVMGAYRDVPLVQPTGQATDTERAIAETEGVIVDAMLPEDAPHLVYECYTEIGSGATAELIGSIKRLERDETGKRPGYPLPYRVSIDVDSQTILEIRRNWKKGDPNHEAKVAYVKYGFIPGLGFYDLGLIHLVGNPTQAATMIQRAMVDSALFANFPGGVFLQGANRQANTVIRPSPGEFVGIPTGGAASIRDAIMPMPYRPPGAEEAALLDRFEQQVKRIAGLIELPIGEGMTNTPVGTILAYLDAVSMVPGAVHKDDHISQSEEFEKLRELFAADPESLWKGRKRPAREWQTAKELMSPELVPAADPNTPSSTHRFMRAQALVALSGLPQFAGIANPRAVYRLALRILDAGADPDLELPQAPPGQPAPDPKVVAAQIRAQADQQKAQSALEKAKIEHEGDMQEIAARAEAHADEQHARLQIAAMKQKADEKTAAVDHYHRTADRAVDAANQAAERQQADLHHQEELQQQAQQFSAPIAAPSSEGSAT